MVLGLISKVYHTYPETPVQINTNGDHAVTLKDLISVVSPDFSNNSCSLFNPLLFNGHLQTAYAGVGSFDSSDHIFYGRRLLNYPDGGSGTADFMITEGQYLNGEKNDELPPRTRFLTEAEMEFYDKDQTSQTKPLVLVLHGLSGGSYESYVRCLLKKLDLEEFDAVVLNARGCSNSKLTSPQLFCGLWTDDVRFLVNDLKAKFPMRSIYGVGFSLGSTILSNYIGQEGETCKLTAACLLGNPWDMTESSYALHRSYIGKYIYSPVMCGNLKKLIDVHFKELSQDVSFLKSYNEKYDKVNTLSDFDNAFTAKMFGFNTAFEYYRHASPVNRLLNVSIPTLIINSKDDPIVGEEAIPYMEVEKNPYLLLITTDYGGHLGWFKYNNERWYSQPLIDFFKGFHKMVKFDKTGKASIKDEGELPHENSFVKDRLVLQKKNVSSI